MLLAIDGVKVAQDGTVPLSAERQGERISYLAIIMLMHNFSFLIKKQPSFYAK